MPGRRLKLFATLQLEVRLTFWPIHSHPKGSIGADCKAAPLMQQFKNPDRYLLWKLYTGMGVHVMIKSIDFPNFHHYFYRLVKKITDGVSKPPT
jgi:hypothetical protein